jgi:hypothetical protein
MVWGAIGFGYKSRLIFIAKTLDAATYQRMFQHYHIFDDLNLAFTNAGRSLPYFQQDGAPPHKAKSTLEYLREKIPLIENWPPNSPDLSPIENLWGIIKRRLSIRGPKNITELRHAINEEWKNIDQDLIDSMMKSINGRFKLCIRHKGNCISHLLTRKRLANAIEPIATLMPRQIGRTDTGKTIILWGRIFHIISTESRITLEIQNPMPEREGEKLANVIVDGPVEVGNRVELNEECFIEAIVERINPALPKKFCYVTGCDAPFPWLTFVRFIETDDIRETVGNVNNEKDESEEEEVQEPQGQPAAGPHFIELE